MRGKIIWDKSASNPVLRDTHEYILVFSKGDFKREKRSKIIKILFQKKILWNEVSLFGVLVL